MPAQNRRVNEDPCRDPWFELMSEVARKNVPSRQAAAHYRE